MSSSEASAESLRLRVEDVTGARHVEMTVSPDTPVAATYGDLAVRFDANRDAMADILTFTVPIAIPYPGTDLYACSEAD